MKHFHFPLTVTYALRPFLQQYLSKQVNSLASVAICIYKRSGLIWSGLVQLCLVQSGLVRVQFDLAWSCIKVVCSVDFSFIVLSCSYLRLFQGEFEIRDKSLQVIWSVELTPPGGSLTQQSGPNTPPNPLPLPIFSLTFLLGGFLADCCLALLGP